MKNYFFKALLFFPLFYLSSAGITAQPLGATISNPVNAGTFPGPSFTDTRNNSTANGYGNEIGYPSDDIFYKVTLSSSGELNVSHCSSGFDTYLHLLDANGTLIDNNDDNGPLCTGLTASISRHLTAGTYYIASEGYSSYSGDITTDISFYPDGATFGNAIDAGTMVGGTPFSSTQNNSVEYGFGNDMGQASDDIYYKFTLSSSAEVSISQCASGFDTYLHLLDVNGAIVTSNDDNGPLCTGLTASIKVQLSAGTYYAVSEGYSSYAGSITTELSIPADTGDTPDEFANRVRYIFQHVDSSPVTTGLLMDAGAEFLNLDNFTGTGPLTDSNFVSINDWRGIYGSLMTAQFNNQVNFTNFTNFNTTLNSAIAGNLPVPLVLLNYNYQVLREDAISANLMYASNDQLYDVPNRTASPYLTKTCFAVASAKDLVVAPGGWVDFIFKPELTFGNTGKIINQLKIDLGNGAGLQVVQPGTAFTTQYASGGYKNLTYEVSYTDNSVYTGHSRVYIQWESEYTTPGGGELMRFHARPDTVIEASTPYGTKRATLQFRMSDQRTGTIIKKPLIVVEGIDFWRITSPNDNTENTDIANLTDAQLRAQIFPNMLSLSNEIDIAGYDIIYIDFEDAMDRLESNSALVREAIAWVNNNKQPLDGVMQQNVVLGLSMGGVLARHALRTMEVNNTAHDTRLYISMDAPHQGANFPLSLQAMIKHLNNAEFSLFWGAVSVLNFKDQFPGIETAKKILDAPAVKQLIKYRIGAGFNLPVDNTEHTAFYDAYKALGYPTQCRNVAISNGSECGISQPYGPLTTLFKREENVKIPYVLDVLSSVVQFIGGSFSNRPLVGMYAPLSFLSTKTRFIVYFEAKGLPDHQVARIYKGQVAIKRKILGLFNVNPNITNRSAYSASYMLPLDNAPGGQTNFANAAQFGMPPDFANQMSVSGFSYIPTVSSLDIGGGNAVINTDQLMSAYSVSNPPVSPYSTPFSSFVTSVRNNEDHFTFTSRNGSLLLKELNANVSNPISCTTYCNATLAITGNDVYCNSGTYSVNIVPADAIVEWTATGGVTFPSGNTGLSVTINNSIWERTTLTATVRSSCGEFTVSRTINSGNPMYPSGEMMVEGEIYPTVGTYYEYTVPDYPGAISYSWHVGTDYDPPTIYQNGTNRVGVYFNTTQFHYVVATVTTSCGDHTMENQILQVYPQENYSTYSTYSYSPNPASSELVVQYDNTEPDKVKKDKSFEIKLYDNKGKVWAHKKNSVGQNSVSIDTRDIPNDTYFLHIHDDKEIIKKQVIIKH